MGKLKVLSLFSGVGAYEESLNKIDVPFELVNYCEFDNETARAYSLIHNVDISKNLGDITQVNEKELDDFDLMTYSFPCQSLSALGKRDGLIDENGNKTKSGLFFDSMRIAKEKKPKYMIAENVRGLVSKPMKEDFDTVLTMLDELGYNTYYKVLNSKNYGVPQSRNRVFIVSIRKDVDDQTFEFPEKFQSDIVAKDLYQQGEIPDEYYIEEAQHKYFNEFRLKKKYSSLNSDELICMTTKQGQRSNPQNFIQDEKGYRMLTRREFFAFQGFSPEYGDLLEENGFTTSKVGFMLGNSITVNVLDGILENLLSEYQDGTKVKN